MRRLFQIVSVVSCIYILTLFEWMSVIPPRLTTTTTTTTTKLHALRRLKTTTTPTEKSGFKILALGGSTTWGANLPHRSHSYPYQLSSMGNNQITNAAVRATGSSYPSLCLSSMIGSRKFDVVLLEFSLNGYEDLELLLKRLRTRFPDAIIIYIHLYSLKSDIVDSEGRVPSKQHDDKIKPHNYYVWNTDQIRHFDNKFDYIKRIVDRYNGYMFALPRHRPLVEKSFQMFAHDWHHLSGIGHREVALGVRKILQDVAPDGPPSEPRLHDWHMRDSCETWFATGQCPVPFTGEDTRMVIFQGFVGQGDTVNKYALQFKNPGSILLNNSLERAVPLYLFFMTMEDFYPVVKVEIGDQKAMINPKNGHTHHVMKSQRVGLLAPGENEVMIEPIGDWELPFRLTAFALCEACLEFDTDSVLEKSEDEM